MATSSTWMQAALRHNVYLAAQDFGDALLHVHQLKQAQLAAFVVKNRSKSELELVSPTRCRAKQADALNPEAPKFSLARLQLNHCLGVFHTRNITFKASGTDISRHRATAIALAQKPDIVSEILVRCNNHLF